MVQKIRNFEHRKWEPVENELGNLKNISIFLFIPEMSNY